MKLHWVLHDTFSTWDYSMRSGGAWFFVYDVCGINRSIVFLKKISLTLFWKPQVHCHLFILELELHVRSC